MEDIVGSDVNSKCYRHLESRLLRREIAATSPQKATRRLLFIRALLDKQCDLPSVIQGACGVGFGEGLCVTSANIHLAYTFLPTISKTSRHLV